MVRSLALPYFECQDDSHSYQACLLMVFQYVLGLVGRTLDDLDQLLGVEPGHHPCPAAALPSLQEDGWEAAYYTNFPWEKYSAAPKEQLEAIYGKEGAKLMEVYPVPAVCQKQLTAAHKTKSVIKPGLVDMAVLRQLHHDGWQLIVGLNIKALKGEKGFALRYVVVTGLNDKAVTLHDPGPGGKAQHKVGHDLFLKAWRYPQDQGELVALRQALTPIVAELEK